MSAPRRWQPCVDHRGQAARTFISDYFASPERRCVLVAGAGFDPRATIAAASLAETLGDRLSATLIREERPAPSRRTKALADKNVAELQRLVPQSVIDVVAILDTDNAVVGGRNAVEAIRKHDFAAATDIVVDVSALSIGTSFPIVRYLLEYVERADRTINLHVVVVSMPEEDELRRHVSNDIVSTVHSFHGDLHLHGRAESAKLWIPQLSIPKHAALRRIYEKEEFDDVCPILPFPSRNPRAGDIIAEHFRDELDQTWEVDGRNIVYASDDDPLDVYRSILDIEELRRPVFDQTLGSVVVLSPVGSKAVALGSLMAAIERSLPVVYVEALKYDLPAKEGTMASGELVHVWLFGEAYSSRREEMRA